MAISNGQSRTTQRAYTLRLRGADKNDHSWREALWATHEAVNKGAKVFGDWLLTLRGGLCHKLADAKVEQGKNKPERGPNQEERRGRRILLALSWLSVESAPRDGDPHRAFVVASGRDDCQSGRNEKVITALRKILGKRGVVDAELEAWVKDCGPSLSAAIREDAVWVDRSAAFDAAVRQESADPREDSRVLLQEIFTDDLLTLPRRQPKPKKHVEIGDEGNTGPGVGSSAGRDPGAEPRSGKGAGQRTRHPFSHIFGAGRPFGKSKHSLLLRDHWHSHLEPLINATGIPLRTAHAGEVNTTSDPTRGRSPTELHREMFSKAAARLAQILTKQKQQEVERQERQAADEALRNMEQCEPFAKPLSLLNEFCVRRRVSHGTSGTYRITRRQIAGWSRVVDSWATIEDQDAGIASEKRVEAAKALQVEDCEKKFGDINLFIAMAEEHFRAVWFHDRKPNAEILEKYVQGTQARADAVRLKVASYRHPDPYFNPIFCQFGNSRPAIEFERLKPPAGRDRRAVSMLLWSQVENKARLHEVNAVSLRFDREIGAAGDASVASPTNPPRVTRRSRLGRAAAGIAGATGELVPVSGVFDRRKVTSRAKANGTAGNGSRSRNPEWNATLSVDRRALAAVGKLVDSAAGETKIKNVLGRLRWTLIVSLELEPCGPWQDFVSNSSDKSPFQRARRKNAAVGQGPEGDVGNPSHTGWPFEEPNTERGFHAKLMLSRLPGLRVLSVDLGHRYAAACAVWEALSKEQMKSACADAGRDPPTETDMFLHLTTTSAGGKKRTTIYRRVGADKLRDGKEHPAPWARLDRQFLIKLPGEERPPRAASSKGDASEIQQVAQFAARIGLVLGGDSNHGRAVDELISGTVRNAALGLKRHARRAKIAYAIDPNTKAIPGMGGSEKLFTPGDEEHVKFLTDALFDWHALAGESKWDDKHARNLWNQHIANLDSGAEIHDPQPAAQATDNGTRLQRRRDDDALRQRLMPIAKQLAVADRAVMHAEWKARWEKDDGRPAGVNRVTGERTAEGSGLHADIRWLTNWAMGRCLPGVTGGGWRQNVGGLSVTRIAAMKSLYQLHKAFAMRARPENPRGAPGKGESNIGFAQSILDAMERMREQRVKQLASRIAEAALGIGRIQHERLAAGAQRPRGPVDRPCHAVIVENLTNYRPDELQTRRENRQLMDWSSSKVKKYLAEACQLHGLHLREVQPNYTSRQDSRTGAPGVRCTDVTIQEFMNTPWWRKQVNAAMKKRDEKNGGSARDRYLLELDAMCQKIQAANLSEQRPLRIPSRGGEIFISAKPCGCPGCVNPGRKRSPGLQADLNAAANIGLKALLDPDWPGKWWYVPCVAATNVPDPDRVKGSPLFDGNSPLGPKPATGAELGSKAKSGKPTRGKKKDSREMANRWRDVSTVPPLEDENWQSTAEYWNRTESRVIDNQRRDSAT